jgi:hypothetical protein
MADQFLKERVGDFQSILNTVPIKAGIKLIIEGEEYISAYNVLAGAASIGQPATVAYDDTYGTKVIAPATTNFPVKTVVAIHATARYALDWWQHGGDAYALVSGDTVDVTAGLYLEVINAGTYFVADGSSRTTVSAAVACAAEATTTVLMAVKLIPEQHTIANS